MLRRVALLGGRQPWQIIARRRSSTSSSAVEALLIRSLKDHYLQIAKTKPTPSPELRPPSSFTVVDGALDNNGPVLKGTYCEEEIRIHAMRLANIMPGRGKDDDGAYGMYQLFLRVDVSKPGQEGALHFLCGLYPDALGIHSVSVAQKPVLPISLPVPPKYGLFENLNQSIKDALHNYLQERGVNESLFPFLQTWVNVKDHWVLMRWYKSVATFINEQNQAQEA